MQIFSFGDLQALFSCSYNIYTEEAHFLLSIWAPHFLLSSWAPHFLLSIWAPQGITHLFAFCQQRAEKGWLMMYLVHDITDILLGTKWQHSQMCIWHLQTLIFAHNRTRNWVKNTCMSIFHSSHNPSVLYFPFNLQEPGVTMSAVHQSEVHAIFFFKLKPFRVIQIFHFLNPLKHFFFWHGRKYNFCSHLIWA